MIKNVKIRFNLNNENDRKAYDYLQGAEKSYSKAVISAKGNKCHILIALCGSTNIFVDNNPACIVIGEVAD